MMVTEKSTRRHGYLQALLDSCPAAIIAINSKGIITFINKEACLLLECGMTDLVGKSIATVYESPEVARETNRILYQNDGLMRDHESRVKTKSGKIIPLRISACHMTDSEGNYAGGVGFFEKYRPWSAGEAHLNARVEELEAQLQKKKEMAAFELSFELCCGLVIIPIVGKMGVRQLDAVTSSVVTRIKDSKPHVVLFDLSKAVFVDERVLQHFVKMLRTIYLLGGQVIVCGMEISLAQSLEPLVADMSFIKSFSSTDAALNAAFGLLGYQLVKR